MLISVRIRGIYSTALTKLLLKNNFRIVNPSEAIRERFNLPKKVEKEFSLDLDIYDRLDRQGINAVGEGQPAKMLTEVLQSTFDDAVYRVYPSIYQNDSVSDNQTNSEIVSQDFLRDSHLIVPGRKIRLNVEFPGSSKQKMDSLRAEFAPTLEGHHYFKACGGRIASLLDLAEKMPEKDCPREEVKVLFKESVKKELPSKGSKIDISHVKIGGKVFNLGPAKISILDWENGLVKIVRTFVKKGVYDGLEVVKELGDYAITEMKMGDWSFYTKYYSKNQEYKGTYVNINTPIELYPEGIRYVDLETDICLWTDGRTQIVDQGELDEMIHKGYVSRELRQIVKQKTKKVLDFLNSEAKINKNGS